MSGDGRSKRLSKLGEERVRHGARGDPPRCSLQKGRNGNLLQGLRSIDLAVFAAFSAGPFDISLLDSPALQTLAAVGD